MNRIPGFLAIAGLLVATGCGGSGVSSPTPPTLGTATHSANASSTLTFSIPLGNGLIGSAPQSVVRAQSSSRHPMFLDGNASNGAITLILDGTVVMNNVSFGTSGTPGAGPSQNNIALPGGGSFSYTSTISQGAGNQPWVTVTGNFTSFAGKHTIGVVQTNGPCTATCIPTTDGYVLADGQSDFVLQSGSNPTIALYLKGVIESAYLCDFAPDGVTPLCDGHAGTVQPDGSYPLYVVVADENGTAIVNQQLSDGSTLPFDNGPYSIVEQGNNILTITQPSTSYSTPGTSRHGLYGEAVSIKCNGVGTTSLAVVLSASAPAKGPVDGFTYVPGQNYPTPGSTLGSVGADTSFGNVVSVGCTATGNLTIQ